MLLLEVKELMKKQIQQQETSMDVMKRSLFTGFVGGVLFSFLGLVLYYFNFLEISPKAILVRSWLRYAWAGKWPGDLLSLLIAGILSVAAAFIYFVLFRKIISLWIGVMYGFLLWILVFLLITPLLYNIPALRELSVDTIVTSICLYLLYGAFVGFSIAYDHYDTVMKAGSARK